MRTADGKRMLAVVLTIALQGYTSASTGTAMLQVTKGHVQVNGTDVPSSVAIAGGESIKVDADSSASLRMQHTSILASSNTRLKWISPSELTLHDGNIFVDTLHEVKTNLGTCGSVIPTRSGSNQVVNSYTKYEVQVQGNRAYVYARELPVTIQTDSRSIELEPLKVAVVESIRASKCKVGYYNTLEDAVADGILIGSYTAAPIVLLNLPDSVSAECPSDRCP